MRLRFGLVVSSLACACVLAACSGAPPLAARPPAGAIPAAAVRAAAATVPARAEIAATAAYANGTLTLTNASGQPQDLSQVELTFSDPDAIADVWGTPWMAWQIAREGTAYVLDGGSTAASWKPGGTVAIAFSPPYGSTTAPSGVHVYRVLPAPLTPLAVGASESGGTIALVNAGGVPIALRALELRFRYPGTIAGVWGAPWIAWTIARSGDAYVLTGGTKDTSTLAPGATLTVQFTPVAGAAATGIVLDGTLAGSSASPSPAPSAAPTASAVPTATPRPAPSVTPTAVPTPAPVPSVLPTEPPATGAAYRFAPYADMGAWPQFQLGPAARSTGTRYYTLAFVVSDGTCRGAWGGTQAPDDPNYGPYFTQQVAALRALGGDGIVSFGGENGVELAQACSSPAAAAAAYEAIVDAYRFTHVDFDIEGGAVADPVSVARRSQALALVQQHYAALGTPLTISYTLPVLPSGLTADGLNVVRSAAGAGVNLALVNLMAMDYGDWAAPSPAGRMGAYAIQSAQSTHAQLAAIYPAKSAAQLYAMLGLTPMIGVNDASDEIFGLNDAAQVLAWARQAGLGRLAFWSATRDIACAGGAKSYAASNCSSVVQAPGAFEALMAGY